jgi:RNA polymerase sigma-70 factor, ECF subfamily
MVKTNRPSAGVSTSGPDLAGRSDAALVAELVNGSEEALLELYRRHSDQLFRAAVLRLGDRQLAEEVVQDTYLALWNRAELFDAGQGSLLTWLSAIARNRAVDMYRRGARRPVALPLSALLPDEGGENMSIEEALRTAPTNSGRADSEPEQWLDGVWLRGEVDRALRDIPEPERQVITLAYFEELSQSEIAARLDWPLGTVKTRTRRALARLRETLAAVVHEPPDPARAREPTDGPR